MSRTQYPKLRLDDKEQLDRHFQEIKHILSHYKRLIDQPTCHGTLSGRIKSLTADIDQLPCETQAELIERKGPNVSMWELVAYAKDTDIHEPIMFGSYSVLLRNLDEKYEECLAEKLICRKTGQSYDCVYMRPKGSNLESERIYPEKIQEQQED